MIINKNYNELVDTFENYGEYQDKFIALYREKSDNKAWGKAQQLNSKNSYHIYLKNYYNGIYTNEAKIKVDEFIRLEKEKELEEQRLRDIEIAKERARLEKVEKEKTLALDREKEAWKLVLKKNTKEDYENYLKYYSNGYYTEEAESKIFNMNLAEEGSLWDKVSKKDNEKFYKEYLNKYPNGMYYIEAKKYLKEVYSEITRDCDDYRFFIFFDDNKQGVRALNKEAKNHNHYFSKTIEAIYLNIKTFSNGLLLVENQNYEEALFTRAGYEIFKFGKYRLVEDKGKNKTNITFNKNSMVSMSMSFIQFNKQVIYNEKFMQIFDSSVKKIIDTRNLTFGYIGGDEKLLVEPILEYVSLLKNGLAIAKIKNKNYLLFNREYEIKLSKVDYIESEFVNGLSIYKRDNKAGLINDKGEELIYADSFEDIILTKVGISICKERTESYCLFNLNKQFIRTNGVLSFSNVIFLDKEEVFLLNYLGYVGFANNKGEITIPCEIEKLDIDDEYIFSQKLFLNENYIKIVNKNEKKGLINNKGEYQIEPLYDRLDYSKDKKVFLVGIGDRVGFIDINGKVLLKIDKYEMARFDKEVTRIKINSLYGLINWEIGEIILPIKYTSMHCEYIENNIYKFTVGFKSGLIDSNGKIILNLVNILKFNSLKKKFLEI